MASTEERIKMEIKQLKLNPEAFFDIFPDPGSIFNIHFTILGPIQTAFEEGYYHGVIMLPENYPFSPPDIKFLNENGRFIQHKNICTNFTSYHPEAWSSSWGIRVILLGLRSMFDEETPEAVGSIVAPPEQRLLLAEKSREYKCPTCGCDHSTLDLYDFKKPASEEAEETAAAEPDEERLPESTVLSDKSEKAEVPEKNIAPSVMDPATSEPNTAEKSLEFLQELYNIVYEGKM